MFIVCVTYGIGFNKPSDVFFLTEDIKRAVEVARSVEDYGFKIKGLENWVTIDQLEANRVYSENDFRSRCRPHPPSATRVFSRHHGDNYPEGGHRCNKSCWIEEWYNPQLQEVALAPSSN